MSYSIRARNINEAFPKLHALLASEGEEQNSRNGWTIELASPLALTIEAPQERVLFCRARRANPFFHLFEALWMLAGRRDLSTVLEYNQNMERYSDDGIILAGAYGYRWREAFGFDQIDTLAGMLREQPDTRRAVLQMWDPAQDCASESLDIPCNTQAYFLVRNGALRMSVLCRSNDLFWGLAGANVVHFSMLQEHLAHLAGCELGPQTHFANSLHAYSDVLEKFEKRLGCNQGAEERRDPYSNGEVEAFPLHLPGERFSGAQFAEALEAWLSGALGINQRLPAFIALVADPALAAWGLHKRREYEQALNAAEKIAASDWRRACVGWLLETERLWLLRQAREGNMGSANSEVTR